VAAFTGISARAEKLSQHRFLSAFVVSDLALQRGAWWPPKADGSGRPFAWCTKGTALSLPAVTPGDRLRLVVRAAVGPAPLRVNVNRKTTFTVAGDGTMASLHVPAEALFTDRPNAVFFDRAETYPPGGKDLRPLAAAVYSVELMRDDRFEGSLGDLARLEEIGVTVGGFYGRETFRDGVVGRWSEPDAWIQIPVTSGTVTMTLLAPRPGETTVEVLADGTRLAGPWVVPTAATTYAFKLPQALAARGSLRLKLRVNPYTPPAPQGRTSRTLGVVVSSLAVGPTP
jgi:hypothetical protein